LRQGFQSICLAFLSDTVIVYQDRCLDRASPGILLGTVTPNSLFALQLSSSF